MVEVGTILIKRSLKLMLCVITFCFFTLGLYVRFTVGTGFGLGGNHNVGFGFGATPVGFLVAVPPLPLFAVMMIWLFSVKTSTQAVVEQSALATVGNDKTIKTMRISKRFMCRDDKCVMRLMAYVSGLTVDTCDTLRT